MPAADESDPPAAGCGAVLLAAGLILVAVLVLEGVLLLRVEEPSMGHIGHVGATLMLGPVALVMVLAGFHLLRRRRRNG